MAEDEGLDPLTTADIANLRAELVRRAREKRAKTGRQPFDLKPYLLPDPAALARRDWLYGHHLCRKFISMTVSRGGLGKTTVLITDALAMVTGRNLVGDAPAKALRVMLVTTEDPASEIDLRIAAACQHYGISQADIERRLFIRAGPKAAIILADDAHDGISINEKAVDKFIVEVVGNDIDVVLIDPVIDTSTVDENSNTKVAALMRLWIELAEDTGVAIGLCHHVRKPAGPDQVLSSDDARGAGTLINKVRDSRVLNMMTRKEAEAAGIEDRRSYFRLGSDKRNMAPAEQATWRRIVGVPIANGEEVGVVEAWIWRESLFDEISTEDLREVQRRIAGGTFRADRRSGEWAGKVVADVLGLDPENIDAKKAIAAVLRKWVQTGVLREVKRKDGNRQKRVFVEVGRWVD